MNVVLYRETESYGRGSPEDESESWTTTSKLVIVPQEDDDDYQEHIASKYGDQDYSYRFSSKMLCVLTEEELQQMKELINEVHR